MKKKILAVMLSAILTVTMLVGCGDSVETGGTAETTGMEAKEQETDNSLETETEAKKHGMEYNKVVEYPLSISVILFGNDEQDMSAEIEYDDVGNMVKSILYNSNGSIRQGIDYEYNAFGNVIKYRSYRADYSYEGEVEYEYDTSGNMTKFRTHEKDEDGIVTEIEWEGYEYDDYFEDYAAYMIEDLVTAHAAARSQLDPGHINFGGFGGWVEPEYDVNGNIIKQTEYNADGKIIGWYEREIDTFGNVTKHMEYDSNGSIVKGYECEYDNFGNEIKYTKYDFDGNIVLWYVSEYDTFGNMTKYTQYNPDSSVSARMENKYDSTGNLEESVYEYNDTIQARFEKEYDANSHEMNYSFYYYGTYTTSLWTYDMETQSVIFNYELLVKPVHL